MRLLLAVAAIVVWLGFTAAYLTEAVTFAHGWLTTFLICLGAFWFVYWPIHLARRRHTTGTP